MMKYKGYYIDKVVFNNKADIDAFVKERAIKAYKAAVEMFMIHPDMEHSLYADEKAEALNKDYGLDWAEIEKIEISVYEKAAM